MDTSKVNLLNYQDNYFLLNYSLKKPVMISRRVYEILTKIKNSAPLLELRQEYGEELIEQVIHTVNDLEKRNIIDSTAINLRSECQKAMEKYQMQEIELLEGTIMVSQDCNMACRYCYGGESGRFNRKGLMSTDMAERIFRYMLSAGGNREFQKVVFLGGEPLLNMKVIRHVVMKWEEIKHLYPHRKVYFALTTNGVLLTPEIVEFFRDYKVGVAVSLDGPKEIHDANRILSNQEASFDKVMQGIELLRKYGLTTSIRSTITRNTDFDKMQAFFAEQDFDIHTASVVDYPEAVPQNEYQLDLHAYAEYLSKQRKAVRDGGADVLGGNKDSYKAKQMSMSFHSSKSLGFPFLCGGGVWLATFGADGHIYPCNRLAGRERFRIGDIDSGIDKDRMIRIMNEFLDTSEKCNACWAASGCKGRCIHQKADSKGTLKELPEELCDIYRENIADSILFSYQFNKALEGNKVLLDEVVIRYTADYLMEIFSAAGPAREKI